MKGREAAAAAGPSGLRGVREGVKVRPCANFFGVGSGVRAGAGLVREHFGHFGLRGWARQETQRLGFGSVQVFPFPSCLCKNGLKP